MNRLTRWFNYFLFFLFIWYIQQVEGAQIGYIIIALITTPIIILWFKAVFQKKEGQQ